MPMDRAGVRADGGTEHVTSVTSLTAAERLCMLGWYSSAVPDVRRCISSQAAETNRAPFPISCGRRVVIRCGLPYRIFGMGFALFFPAEYANMILIRGFDFVMFLWWLAVSIPQSWVPECQYWECCGRGITGCWPRCLSSCSVHLAARDLPPLPI